MLGPQPAHLVSPSDILRVAGWEVPQMAPHEKPEPTECRYLPGTEVIETYH